MAAGALSGLPGDAAILPGGGLSLTRPTSNTNRSVRSPAKRGASGGVPGWRLAPYPGYRVMRLFCREAAYA
ncbi:hypothetical protein TUM16656_54500 [Klebsiella pneumoniae]|nr:hypothetical protein TUM16656_54500 [Klebsiella pneumoniae]GJK27834.1 hypothetical protein TUM17555_55090 [Klebsiella pneumoniae]GJK82517.1 hypothetical protein TUM17566_45690 [Klebsiella pneumoniae]